MGAVYEAVDQRLGITVALKGTFSADTNLRKQFEHEARLLASLQHPALPRVTDHFVEDDRAFLVMQFIAGVDLARIIYQQPGPFPRQQVVAWADQLLDALIYLHSQDRQVIHRDIKPHNLKLTATGQIALLDFGLAKAQISESSTTPSPSFFGYTRQYSPLEQIQATSTGPHSDIYALGATLYHLLTGIKPADALMRAAAVANGQGDPLKPANLIHPAVGSEIAAILTKAMAQNPEQRYRSAAEFREALRRVGRHAPSRNSYQPYPAGSVLFSEVADDLEIFKTLPTSRGRKGDPLLIALIVTILLSAAGGLLFAYQRWQAETNSVSDGQKPLRPARESSHANTASSDAPPFTPEKTGNGLKARTTKPLNAVSRRDRSDNTESIDIAIADQLQRLEEVKLATPGKAKRADSITDSKIEPSRQIKIPEIRLPTAEVQQQDVNSGLKPILLDPYRPAVRPASSWTGKTP
jgi:serine/threonine protein kinase